MAVTICEVLKTLVPEQVHAEFEGVVNKFEINTPLRVAHFLAQCAHESQDFMRVEENLNYSAKRLLQVFPKYFTQTSARSYAFKPARIASRVYANRMGNWNEQSQEGWIYKGRGYIQLTGKDNYLAFDKEVDEDLLVEPNLVATKYPLLSAAWFWNSRSLNAIADQGADQVPAITKIINGGDHGLDDRQARFDAYYPQLIQFDTLVSTDRGLLRLEQLEIKDIVILDENSRATTTEWYLNGELVRKDSFVNQLVKTP